MKLKTALFRAAAGVLGLFGVFAIATCARQERTFDAPVVDIHASKDPAVIERGRYLALGPAHCADCHGPPGAERAKDQTADVPLTGGAEFALPVGTFRVPNITADVETGIGRYRDEELARMLRYGVRPDGQAVLPFMPFSELSDDDLTAVVSYLRTLAPQKHAVKAHEVNTAGRLVKAWVLSPRGPSATPPKSIERGPTVAYGKYLAHSVANCVGCHTKIDMRTGACDGPLFGGGALHPSSSDRSKTFVAPNLTPDATSGWIADWPEDLFVARMKSGLVHDGSPMPWTSFARMTDDDHRAIYRYLRTVPAAAGGPDPANRGSVVLTAAR